jgi:hypothetical protein
MALEKDYNRYTCDRPEKAHQDGKQHIEFIKDGQDLEGKFSIVKRRDINGVDAEYYFCPECYAQYKNMAEQWENDFAAFMKGEK